MRGGFSFKLSGYLVASVAVGLLISSSTWWVQGIAASVPIVILWLALAVEFLLGGSRLWPTLVGCFRDLRRLVVDYFLLAALLSLVPFIGRAAGLFAVAVFVAVYGVDTLRTALREADRDSARSGLYMLGGFLAAGLVLLSNLALPAFGVQ